MTQSQRAKKAAKAGRWRGANTEARWRNLLENHARPIRSKALQDITTTDVVALLKPLWGERQESAEKLREAIERVLDAAKAEGHRRGENPARRKGHLALLMHKPNTLTTGSHHAAMPYGEVPALMSRLQKEKGVNFRALELTILTAVRSGEAN